MMGFSAIKNLLKIGKHVIVKNSPKILLIAGISSGVGATVAGCIAMKKTEPILANHKEKLDIIHEKKGKIEENAYNKEITQEYFRYSKEMGKIWYPCGLLTVASILCSLGSYGIMNKRLSSVSSAFAIMSSRFDKYRENVIADAGEEKDRYYISNKALDSKKALKKELADIKVKEEIKENGLKVVTPETNGVFKYAFNEDNVKENYYSKGPGYNFQFLCKKQDYFNYKLNKNGFVLLSDVYQDLGLSCCKLWEEMHEGRVYGWTMDDCSENIYNDDHVLFDIWENNDVAHRLFRMGQIDDVILTFNCRLFTKETLELLATKGCYF